MGVVRPLDSMASSLNGNLHPRCAYTPACKNACNWCVNWLLACVCSLFCSKAQIKAISGEMHLRNSLENYIEKCYSFIGLIGPLNINFIKYLDRSLLVLSIRFDVVGSSSIHPVSFDGRSGHGGGMFTMLFPSRCPPRCLCRKSLFEVSSGNEVNRLCHMIFVCWRLL